MQVAQQAVMSVKEQRAAAIAETVERIRAIEREQGVNREALDAIRATLLELAARKELFPPEEFRPEQNERGFFPVYRLSEDADHRFALYMSTSLGAKDVPPHNHTTWAVIVGVAGTEENRFYEREDGGTGAGPARLRQVGGETVRPGNGVCLMPEDIHSIHPRNETPAMHLHMYGLALEQLTERVIYDVQNGTCKVYPTMTNIVEAR